IIAGIPRCVLKFPSAPIQIQNRRLVVAKQQDIEALVVVEICEDGFAGSARVLAEAGRFGNVSKCPVSIVPVQPAGCPWEIVWEDEDRFQWWVIQVRVGGYKEVRESVSIQVAESDACTEDAGCTVKSGLPRRLGERVVPIVAVKPNAFGSCDKKA